MQELLPLLQSYWWSLVAAFAAMMVFTPLVIRLAGYMGWEARPQADRWHERPTALMGGLAIYAAATLAVLLFAREAWMAVIWGGATVMFLTGMVDDLFAIRPVSKLMMQVLATGILVVGGYQFLGHAPFWISIPLTFLWVIGITNAVNLLDNMDGLAAGVAGIAALFLGLFAYFAGNPAHVMFLAPVAGAAFGFLLYNFKPARIFMGDCGSLFLGYCIATGGLLLQNDVGAAGTISILLLPIAITAVPIFDTTLVTIGRLLSGRSISEGGRDHSSHRLVFLGLSDRAAVLSLYGISVLFGAMGVVFQFVELHLLVSMMVLLFVAFAAFGIFLGRLQVYSRAGGPDRLTADNPDASGPPVLSMVIRYKKLIFGLLADLGVISACFIVAYYVRFEGEVTAAMLEQLHRALPIVIMVKLFCYYLFGLYKSIWHHAGTPELLRIFGANVVGSVALMVLLHIAMDFQVYSLSVYLIDFLLATLVIGGIRMAFRGLHQIFALQQEAGRPVLLFGVGYGGMISLRELRQNEALAFQPVAFMDDDPALQGSFVQGLPVYHSQESGIDKVLEQFGIEGILITTSKMPKERKEELRRFCEDRQLECLEFHVGFREVGSAQKEPEAVLSD